MSTDRTRMRVQRPRLDAELEFIAQLRRRSI